MIAGGSWEEGDCVIIKLAETIALTLSPSTEEENKEKSLNYSQDGQR